MTHSRVINECYVWGSPPPENDDSSLPPLSMGDKWVSCFDTGSINVHDSWASGWWLILRWWMGVMTWVPVPQKMMTHHCHLSMGDKWASCFDTGTINAHDSWASEWWLVLRWWMGVMMRVPLPQKMMTHHCPLSMGDKWVSCFDTGSINVHDSWGSDWWLILRWWMGVMSRRQLVYFVWMV